MLAISNFGGRTQQDVANAAIVAIPESELTMTAEETKKYHRFLKGLLVFLAAVVLFFSPLVF